MADDGSTAGQPTLGRTRAPSPSPERAARLQAAARRAGVGSAYLLLVVGAVVVVGYVLGRLWMVIFPIVLGLLVTSVLWPMARFLRRHRWPPALAAITVVLGFLAALAGIVAVIAPQIAGQVDEVGASVSEGLSQVQVWLSGPPLNLGQDQIGQAIDSAVSSLQGNAQSIAGYAFTGITAIGSGLVNIALALLLTFFFLKDGPRWVPWLAAQTGPRAAPHVIALSVRAWGTVSEYIRQQALVGFFDALLIGIGLLIVGVPLVLPLAVLTFFAAFIPIVGAIVAGAFAVLIALVSNGLTAALIVLGIVLLVQQIEGNVLQPIIQGRGFDLHPAVVLLAVTAGAGLAGITGALLAVPVAALIAVVYRYSRTVLDGGDPDVAEDGTRLELAGDGTTTRVVRAPVDGGGDVDREQ